MNIIKIIWTIFTTSKGVKRNTAIILALLGFLAVKLGIQLPQSLDEKFIESFYTWAVAFLGFWGVIHSFVDSIIKSIKDKQEKK